MSQSDYSLDAVIEFLTYSAKKGLLNAATARNRKVAVQRILEVADKKEKEDVRNVDVDDVFNRFVNLHGKQVQPSSMKIYKSRCAAALEDFLTWMENPAEFKPKVKNSAYSKKKLKKDLKGKTVKSEDEGEEETEKEKAEVISDGRGTIPTQTVYAPIYGGRSVMIQLKNLPYDLNSKEAEKIKRMLNAILEGLINE